jgi:hypothetical protein
MLEMGAHTGQDSMRCHLDSASKQPQGTDMTGKKLCLTGLLLASLSGLAHAAPTDYVIQDFTIEQGGPAPTSGRFTYDPLVGFTNFLLEWQGATFDLTSAANQPYLTTGSAFSLGSHVESFALLTKTLAEPSNDVSWTASTDCGRECASSVAGFRTDPNDTVFIEFAALGGDYIPGTAGNSGSFTVTAIPEADTLAMFVTGLAAVAGLVKVTRRVRR